MAYIGTSHAKAIQVYHKRQEYAPSKVLPKQAWNIGCKVQKTNNSKILSFASSLAWWNDLKNVA